MAEITIKIPNTDRLVDAFKAAPRVAEDNLSVAIERIIFKLQARAMREAPVNKQSGGGTLRQSIAAGMVSRLVGRILVGAPYAIYVHEGTRPHVIQAIRAKVLANRRTGQIFGTRVNHPGTRPNPFLQRAADQSESEIIQEFEAVAERTFSSIPNV